MSLDEDAPTAANWLNEPGSGVGTALQDEPLQRAARVCLPCAVPTAHASLAETIVTPVSETDADDPSRLVEVNCFQVLPFQRRSRALGTPFLKNVPTAQALDGEEAATAFRLTVLAAPPGSGLGTRFHVLPFQRRIRG